MGILNKYKIHAISQKALVRFWVNDLSCHRDPDPIYIFFFGDAIHSLLGQEGGGGSLQKLCLELAETLWR